MSRESFEPFLVVPQNLRLSDGVHAVVTIGSDLLLVVEPTATGAAAYSFDNDGNMIDTLASFRSIPEAMAMLPTLTTVARDLYPNHVRIER